MLEKLRSWIRKLRIKCYRLLWNDLNPVGIDSAVVTDKLAKFFRSVEVKHLVDISPTRMAIIDVSMWSKNLVALVEHFRIINRLISEEDDGEIEYYVDKFIIKHTCSLDLYLTDDHHIPIDVIGHLIRLGGLIQEHHYLVSKHDNQYYQRQSTRMYQDVIELVNMLLQESSASVL